MGGKRVIRILQATVTNDSGGLTWYICQNYRFIDKSKIQFDFITYDDKLEFKNEFEKIGANFYQIPKPIHFFSYVKKLFEIQKKRQYEIIHLNLSYANVLPIIVAKIIGIKTIIIHSHSTQIDDKRFLARFAKENIHRFGKLLIPKIANVFLACSIPAAKWMFGKSIADFNKYMIIHNAIFIEKYIFSINIREKKRLELGIEAETFCVGHIGRFTYQKNHEYLLKIFAEVLLKRPNSKLVLIGDGDNLQNIKDLVKEKKLYDKILFLGNRKDVPELMQIMDCFVLPSRFEGLPIVGIEAQTAGLPCFFADTITKELGITDLAHFIPLQVTPKEWVEQILQNSNIDRKDMSKEISAAGYDIKTEIKNMEKIYIEHY